QRVVKRGALVDTAAQIKFRRDFELLLENFRLPVFVMRVSALTPSLSHPVGEGVRRTGEGWQAIIIQPGFANGYDFGMPREFAQGRAQIFRRSQRLTRMPADGGVN